MKLAPVISYTGNKYRHLDTILSHLPDNIGTFYDVFGGSGVVGINVAANNLAKSVVYNERNEEVLNLLFHSLTSTQFSQYVQEYDGIYPSDKDGYLDMRDSYNQSTFQSSVRKYAMLYCLHTRSFNNQMRWNKSGQWNLPYGDRNNTQERLEALRASRAALGDKVVGWLNLDYLTLLQRPYFAPDSFFFIDPPYINSVSTYNESGGWVEQDEKNLYHALNNLSQQGIRWMLTNTLYNRGKHNEFLEEFISPDKNGCKYHTEQLNCNHGNSSYHKSDKRTVELLITNY